MLLCFYHQFFGLQEADILAAIAMTAYHQQGEHDKALGAARLIRWALHLHIQSEGPVQKDTALMLAYAGTHVIQSLLWQSHAQVQEAAACSRSCTILQHAYCNAGA